MRFEIFQDVANLWRWRLVARNGRVVAIGESHPDKAKAKRAARTVHGLCSKNPLVIVDLGAKP